MLFLRGIITHLILLNLQAFKFPDSMNVHFQCVVQVCRGTCPEPQCGGGVPRAPALPGRPSSAPNPVDGYGSPAAPAISR